MGLNFRASSLLILGLVCAHCGSSESGATNDASTPATGSGSSSGGGGSGFASSGTPGSGSPGTGSGGGSGGSLSGTPSGSGGGDDGDAGSPGDDGGEGGGSGSSTGVDGGSGACGARTGMRGKTSRSLMVGSTPRTYIAYLPMTGSPTTAMPFVYVFHGATQNAADMVIITQYTALADTAGIAVAFVDGQNTNSSTSATALNPWNVSDNKAAVCGAGDLVNNPNANVDFEFMDEIKADMAQDQCLDSAHTFATGFSMGGYFTHHIACDRTDIRAAAPHSGGTLASLSSCKTGHVPIIIFHGLSDPLIAPGCDDPNSSAQSGFPPSATLWAAKNGCKTTYATTQEMGMNGKNGQCYLYDGCPSDGQVELCTFTSMPHAWAGAAMCPGCIGSGADYVSATTLEWNFFQKYAW
jgi:poly(3-hydroxybutyrate) depolymerase